MSNSIQHASVQFPILQQAIDEPTAEDYASVGDEEQCQVCPSGIPVDPWSDKPSTDPWVKQSTTDDWYGSPYPVPTSSLDVWEAWRSSHQISYPLMRSIADDGSWEAPVPLAGGVSTMPSVPLRGEGKSPASMSHRQCAYSPITEQADPSKRASYPTPHTPATHVHDISYDDYDNNS